MRPITATQKTPRPRGTRDTVASWPHDKIDCILRNWDAFERDGQIDECDLRHGAREVIMNMGHAVPLPIVHVMRDVAFECYRRKAIEQR